MAHFMRRRCLLIVALGLILTIGGQTCLMGATTYAFKDGDTLWDLAYKFFRDPTLFFVFLQLNKISNPRTIPVGTVIIVPSVDEMQKIAKEDDPQKRTAIMEGIRSGTSGASTSTSSSAGKDPTASSDAGNKPGSNEPGIPQKLDFKKATFKNIVDPVIQDGAAVKKVSVGKK